MKTPRQTPANAAQSIIRGIAYPLQQAMEGYETRLTLLENKTGIPNFDPEKQTPIAPVPPVAEISGSATAKSGRFVIRVTNPEYLGRGNTLKTPLLHKLEFSPVPTFASGIVGFPVGVQTYYSVPVEDVGGQPGSAWTGYFRVSSSYDGQNFNTPVRTPVLTA